MTILPLDITIQEDDMYPNLFPIGRLHVACCMHFPKAEYFTPLPWSPDYFNNLVMNVRCPREDLKI